MPKLILTFFLFFNIFFIPLYVYAQNPHTLEEYKACYRLFEVMKMNETTEQTITKMVDMQTQNLPQLAKLKPLMLEFFRKYMSYDSLKNETADIYLKYFTIQDIQQLIEFYQTPLGKKFIKNQVNLTTECAQLGMKRVQEHQEELQKMLMQNTQQ
jgi:hypothetical protein